MAAFEHAYVDKVILGKNVRTIEAFAFNECRMKEIEGMENVTSIGMEAFYDCERLQGIKFGSNLESIGSSAFEKCSSLTGEVVFPENVKIIREMAFADTSVQKAVFWCKDGEYRKFQLYGYVSTAAEEYAKKTEGIQFNSLGGKLSGPNVYLGAGSVAYNGSDRTPVPVVKAGNTVERLQKHLRSHWRKMP